MTDSDNEPSIEDVDAGHIPMSVRKSVAETEVAERRANGVVVRLRATYDDRVLDEKVVHIGERERFDTGREIFDVEVSER